ncbi:MAG: SDR family NAD(P)-dependent oxidoreductase [Ideonella sp.]|nr:SDR family NAD(P)-dependent oxidoreductase [Ideonella sp.]
MTHCPPLADWRGRSVWLVGASTGIGRATASLLHARGARVFVSARNAALLDEFVAAHPGSRAMALDVTDAAALARAADEVVADTGGIDLVCFCAGHYKAMQATDFDLAEALRHLEVNQAGALKLLGAVLPHLLRRGSGHLSLVASVAGYRGLPRALAYGPTKAALINLAEALHLDLAPLGIGVSVINPGFVETPLTAQNAFAMPALLTPDEAARAIVEGWERGRFEIHFPKRFTLWMKLLRLMPDALYLRAVPRFIHP